MACPDDDLLVAMVERSIDPAQFAELEVHIDSCESCRRIVAAAVADTGTFAVGTPHAPVADDVEPIAKLVDVSINDRYVIEAVLGKGGMGTVYLARDLTLDREVAIKLHHKAGGNSERLHREAMAMAKLAHPNVVTVYEVATVDDRLYVAMEFVRGETLRGWRSAHPHNWRAIVAMLVETGNGLAAAHAAGLVHRDFKPENVLVGDDGRPRVGDFGLARVGASPSGDKPISSPNAAALEARMTQTGALVGTPAYMAPEQLHGAIVDARSDQFAFCVVAWELLYGKRPFAGSTLAALEEAITKQDRWLPPKSAVPPRVRAVLERGLSVDPAERFPDMPALLGALRSAATPRTRRRWALALAGTVALAGGGIALASTLKTRHHEAACVDAGDEMRGVFDPARRLQVNAAFITSGVPGAAAAFTRTEKVLTRYANALGIQATATCRGRDEPRVVTLARQSCLADKRRTLDSYVALLGKPDKGVINRSSNSAWAMFEPTPCDDAQTLLVRARHASTTTPETAAKLRELQRLKDLAKYKDGIVAATSLVEATHASGEKDAELQALITLGHLYANVEDLEHTQPTFEQAISLAETMGLDLDAAIGYSALANFHGVVTNNYAAAHRAIGLARAKLERLGGQNPAIRGELLVTEAQIYADENRLGEAEKSLREAAATIEQAYGPEHPKLGSAYGTLSQILRYQHKTAEALAAAEKTLAVLSASYGENHPYVAGAEMTLGQVLGDLDRNAEARERYLRADKVFAKLYGEIHPYRAAIAANLGALNMNEKDYAAAEAQYRRALDMVIKMKGPDHLDACAARGDVARAMALAGRYQEALAEQEIVVRTYEKNGADGEPRLIGGLLDLAHYQIDTKQPKLALASAERALAITAKRAADANPAEVGEAKYLIGHAMWDAGKDKAKARALVEQARKLDLAPNIAELIDKWLAEHRL